MSANPEFFNPYRAFVGSFIPNWLQQRRDISPGAKLAYARLAQFADKRSGIAWPSRRVLASELGVTARQVDRYVSELKLKGLIHITRRGRKETNFYRFLKIEEVGEWTKMSSHPRQKRLLTQLTEMSPKENHSVRESMGEETETRARARTPSPDGARPPNKEESRQQQPEIASLVSKLAEKFSLERKVVNGRTN